MCRGVPPWAPLDKGGNNGAPTEGRPYKLGHYQTRKKVEKH